MQSIAGFFGKGKGDINGYTVTKTLGQGGNAVVKQVEKDGEFFAMKVF